MTNQTSRSVGAGGGDYSMEEPVELRMSDGSYRTPDPNQAVTSPLIDRPNKPSISVEPSKPKAIKFSITPKWATNFIRGRIPNVRGIYASTTITEGSGWQMTSAEGDTYIVSVIDWNNCIDTVVTEMLDLKTETSELMFSDHNIEDDPILGPLMALVT
tara:strand:- start:542 stop:1015 length:474 start_codon:yes stop_codon:yes gene_type:complete